MRDRFLWIGCFAYAALFTGLGALKYDVHRNLIDFGIFAQTATSAFGCFCNPIEGSHWAFHFSPILYVVGAAVAAFRSPLTLVALQAVAGALVAPPIYALVRRSSGNAAIARLGALTVWFYPPLAGLVFGDFHENGFAPAAVAWTLYAFDAGSMAGTLAGSAIVLAIKEDQAIFLAIAGALGAWWFRGTMRGRVAAGIAVACVLVCVTYFALIAPHAAATATDWQPSRFYAWNSGDARSLSSGLPARLGFLLLALGPLLFMPLLSPVIALAVAPLAEVLLSRMPTTFTMGTHYAGAWIGYVLVAFAFGLRRIPRQRLRAVLGACIALCIVEFLVADPLHPGLNLRRVETRDVALDSFLQTLPARAGIATQEEAYTHLALNDPNAALLPEFPNVPATACFVLLDRDFPESARLQEYGSAFATLVDERRYALVARNGGILLYRRAGRCS
ncbi:MAG TPA: DUF2079 domain-containing protein [Candidatus Cybelea sp.]|nr:DUF2079 domain-containing protein [Candidatus Cybelea sp.]